MREDSLSRTRKTATDSDIKNFQGIVGSTMFTMIETRPDILFANFMVSRFTKDPSHAHIETVKRIIRYLNSMRTRGIKYGKGDLTIRYASRRGGTTSICATWSVSQLFVEAWRWQSSEQRVLMAPCELVDGSDGDGGT